MSIIIVHLSDIHIRQDTDNILSRTQQISQVIQSYQHDCNYCAIVVSGDIAFSGKPDQYVLAASFLEQIKSTISTSFSGGVHIVVTPGNHDCNFDKSGKVREIVIRSIIKDAKTIDSEIIDQCSSVQEDFFDFRDQISSLRTIKDNTLWYRYELKVDDNLISFDCINFSWCSQFNENQGELIFPIDQFEHELENSSDLRVFVYHHPLNWIQQGQYQNLRSKFRTKSDIVLCGHEHSGAATKIDDTRNGKSLVIDGSPLQVSGDSDESEFNVLKIDIAEFKCDYNTYTYNTSNGRYDESHSAKNLMLESITPKKVRNELSIQDDFMAWLTDPGANFTHPYKQRLELSDIFVDPDLEKFLPRENEKIAICSSRLITSISEENRIVIRAEENHGKTALLKHLYAELFDNGYLPLYIDASQISKSSKTWLERFYFNAISTQYGEAFRDIYLASDKEKKILLIDDLHRIRVSDRYQHQVMDFCKNLADKIIVTSDESMEFSELISSEISHEFSQFSHYKLRHFGNRLRYELIKKWRSIGQNYNLSNSELIARVDQSEKILNSVIGKNLVPKAPIYVLTILQSLETGNPSNDFHNGGLGYYYQYLITQALGMANIIASELDEFFNFLSELSWFVYNQEGSEVSVDYFNQFSSAYSSEYTYVEPGKRLSRLLKSNILTGRGRFISFSYPYIYYYFLGKHFANNLSENVEIGNILSHCCQHIYLHENANIVMFVTHHSKDRRIIDDILNNLKDIFAGHSPITFDGDADSLNEFVDKTAKIVYRSANPDEVRTRQTQLKDQLEESEDDVPERECETELDLLSKLNKLIKTTEIMGQLLKSYYGSIKNELKREIVREVFNGNLRALRDFYNLIEKEGEALLVEVEGILDERSGDLTAEKRKQLAQKICYQIIGSVSTSMLLKPAISVSSEHLRQVIDDVVEENPSTAFQLIKVASDLELPDAIDIDGIKGLYTKHKDDMFCQRILQSLVLRHLYLFQVSESVKQQVCQAIDVPIEYQSRLDFVNRGAKLT